MHNVSTRPTRFRRTTPHRAPSATGCCSGSAGDAGCTRTVQKTTSRCEHCCCPASWRAATRPGPAARSSPGSSRSCCPHWASSPHPGCYDNDDGCCGDLPAWVMRFGLGRAAREPERRWSAVKTPIPGCKTIVLIYSCQLWNIHIFDLMI